MKPLSQALFTKQMISLLFIIILATSSITYFLYNGFPNHQKDFNPESNSIKFEGLETKFALQSSIHKEYDQYGQFPALVGQLVVFYDDYPDNKAPIFPTTLKNDTEIINNFQIESHIAISKNNIITEVLIHRIEINKTNYLSDITQIITWDPPTPTIRGYSQEYVENYQIAYAMIFSWIYDNGSESIGFIWGTPGISYNLEPKSWVYSGGGAWQLNIIWKNQAYTFAVVATSLILLLVSITLVARKIKYYKDNQINV